MGMLSNWFNAVSDSIRINRSLAAGERVKYLLPFLLAGLLFFFDFFCHGWVFKWSSLASSLVLMSALLLLLPPDFEPVVLSVVLTASTVVICSIPSVLCLTGHSVNNYYVPVTCMVVPVMLAFQLLVRSRDKYSGINYMCRDVTIMHNREDFLRLCHAALVTLFSCVILASVILGGLVEILACVSSAFATLILVLSLEVRARVGMAYCGDKAHPDRSSDETLKDSPSSAQPLANKDSLLYERVERYMQEHQPFLEDGFSLTELAAAMYTNKSYLSRTINHYSGYNFCQYVNKYRIEYAIEMMKKDKRIKILELAMTSGFHSVASFNMAFKLHTNDTPSEYMRTIHLCDGY